MRLFLIAWLAGVLPAAAAAAAAEAPVGRWLTQDSDGVIEITACGDAVCGRVVGLAEPWGPDGGPSMAASGVPMCGFSLLRAEPDGPDRWAGHITDPDEGSTWTCTLRLQADDTLRLRGYVLIPLLGRTQVWTRYAGRIGADCAMGGR